MDDWIAALRESENPDDHVCGTTGNSDNFIQSTLACGARDSTQPIRLT
jgi:hypothetical protein